MAALFSPLFPRTAMELKREWIEDLVFGDQRSRRYTQDSPILPDVWIQYGLNAGRGVDQPVDLLLTPHLRGTAGDLFREVRDRLKEERAENGRSAQLRAVKGIVNHVGAKDPPRKSVGHPNVAYNQSAVVAEMYLDELLRVALPLTTWWRERVCRESRENAPALASRAAQEKLRQLLNELKPLSDEMRRTDLPWLVQLVGCIQLAAESKVRGEKAREKRWEEIKRDHTGQVDRFRRLVVEPMGVPHCADGPGPPLLLFMVSVNRDASPTIADSVLAVKADAARRVFEASCAHLNWAILDSGIDATHGAFRLIDERNRAMPQPFVHGPRGSVSNTRVRATFDFTSIRPLLSGDAGAARAKVQELDGELKKVQDLLAPLAANAPERGRLEHRRAYLQAHRNRWNVMAQEIDADLEDGSDDAARSLKAALYHGRAINWDELRPFIEMPHAEGLYVPPKHDHGTHVAGILGADWREELWRPEQEGAPEPDEFPDFRLQGICPDINLYDFRVFGDSGTGDEFSVMAALQFLRHLNAQREVQLIHGANLSLSIRHDVKNFACGRTPVCDECERVVNSGVVVVAAAGNRGYNRFDTRTEAGVASTYEGYSAISITDPGNAEGVITVGATHRMEPHTYGVSYFSSRGPTGDGRYKPDLVAPGEKIRAPVPGNKSDVKDGTSMAAPHVSGAAALILARHREFIGRPMRVRQVLCASATDLGRDRYFQGAGMVDVLRALQSV